MCVLETERTRMPAIFNVTYPKTLWRFVGPRKMVHLNWFVRQKVLGANIHETEGLLERNIAPHIYTGHVSHTYTSHITNIYESRDTYA